MATHCHNTPARPRERLAGLPGGTRDRLALFAEWTGCEPFPPDQILEPTEDGDTFSTPFLSYCERTGLSLDWVWMADEMALVMAAHNAAKEGAA